MATYLGYATFRMVSDPSTYVEPAFSPTKLPNPLPTGIDWFRVLYEKARGKAKTHVSPKAVPPIVSPSAEETALNAHPPAASRTVPRGARHHSGGSTPRKSRSRSVSGAPSGTSSTIPGSSAASVEDPPPSPSAASEASHESPRNVVSAYEGPTTHYGESGSPSGAMYIDGEEHLAPPPTTLTSHRHSEADISQTRQRPMALRPLSSRRMDQIAPLTVRGSEFGRSTTSRQPLPPLPPPPADNARPVSSLHLVPRVQGEYFVNVGRKDYTD